MKTNLNISNALSLLSEMESPAAKFQVLEYDDLLGSSDLSSAFMLSYMRSANIRLRQVKIVLRSSSVFVESGALSFMRGNLEASSNVGSPGGLIKKFISSSLTGEHTIKPMFTGSGEILLEPSFNHYVLLSLEDQEEVIVDDRLFFAAEGSVTLGAKAMRSISGALLGRETLFQTSLKGPGIAVLEVPVPEQEIFKYKLKDDTLKVDGNIAFLRSGDIDFTVERSTSTLVGTAVAGEGFLHVYRGTGEVWLMQTQHVYDQIKQLDNPFFRQEATEGMLDTQDSN